MRGSFLIWRGGFFTGRSLRFSAARVVIERSVGRIIAQLLLDNALTSALASALSHCMFEGASGANFFAPFYQVRLTRLAGHAMQLNYWLDRTGRR